MSQHKEKEKDYQEMTREELYEIARKKNIPDKSSKSKKKLAEELKESDKGTKKKASAKFRKEKTKASGKSQKDESKNSKKEQLLEFLDNKAFDPVLNVRPDTYKDENKKKMLKDAQGTTRSTKRRYHNDYKTAEDVKNNYESDLNSDAAEDVHKELKQLGLPSLPELDPEFKYLCKQLGIH